MRLAVFFLTITISVVTLSCSDSNRAATATERYYDSYLCSGVTAAYDVGGMTCWRALEESAEGNLNAPHVAAAGPMLTPVPGAPFDLPSDRVLVQLDSEKTGVKMVQYVSALGSTGVKFWQLQADNEEYMARVVATAEEIRRQELNR